MGHGMMAHGPSKYSKRKTRALNLIFHRQTKIFSFFLTLSPSPTSLPLSIKHQHEFMNIHTSSSSISLHSHIVFLDFTAADFTKRILDILRLKVDQKSQDSKVESRESKQVAASIIASCKVPVHRLDPFWKSVQIAFDRYHSFN